MTNAQLRIAGSSISETREEPRLRDKVNAIIDKRRRDTVALIEKTIIFHAEVGGTQLHVDDLPNLHPADTAFVMKWLRDEGFRVTKPRFGGRPVLDLVREDRPE